MIKLRVDTARVDVQTRSNGRHRLRPRNVSGSLDRCQPDSYLSRLSPAHSSSFELLRLMADKKDIKVQCIRSVEATTPMTSTHPPVPKTTTSPPSCPPWRPSVPP